MQINWNEMDTAIQNRTRVRITRPSTRLVGTVGILMGYNAQYHTVKIGFIGDDGRYTGEFTKIPADAIELVKDPIVKIVSYEVQVSDDQGRSWRQLGVVGYRQLDLAETFRQTAVEHTAKLGGSQIYRMVERRETLTVIEPVTPEATPAKPENDNRYIVVQRPDGFVVVDSMSDIVSRPYNSRYVADHEAERWNAEIR